MLGCVTYTLTITYLISAALDHQVQLHLEEVLLVGEELGEDQSGFALRVDGYRPALREHDARRPLVRIRVTLK